MVGATSRERRAKQPGSSPRPPRSCAGQPARPPPRSYESIAAAARLPSPVARMTVAARRTTAPPANTLGISVTPCSSVSASGRRPRRSRPRRRRSTPRWRARPRRSPRPAEAAARAGWTDGPPGAPQADPRQAGRITSPADCYAAPGLDARPTGAAPRHESGATSLDVSGCARQGPQERTGEALATAPPPLAPLSSPPAR